MKGISATIGVGMPDGLFIGVCLEAGRWCLHWSVSRERYFLGGFPLGLGLKARTSSGFKNHAPARMMAGIRFLAMYCRTREPVTPRICAASWTVNVYSAISLGSIPYTYKCA